jgi:hypothetical protein
MQNKVEPVVPNRLVQEIVFPIFLDHNHVNWSFLVMNINQAGNLFTYLFFTVVCGLLQSEAKAYQILTDTNSMYGWEALQAPVIATDGVQSFPIWAEPNVNWYDYWVYRPGNLNWTTIMRRLNAHRWIISADEYDPRPRQDSGNDDPATAPYIFQRTKEITGFEVNGAIVYHEFGGNGDNITLTRNELTWVSAYIQQQTAKTPVLLLARNYGDTTKTLIDDALTNPDCGGVVFEFNSNDMPLLRARNILQGIQACLAAGKKCYLLLASSKSGNYLSDVMGFMENYLNLRPDLKASPNLYLVIAAYGRNKDDTGTGFLIADYGSATNTVLAAKAYLRADQTGFAFPLEAGATYRIVSQNSGKLIDVEGFSLDDGHLVHQWHVWDHDTGTDNQLWTAYQSPCGWWYFINVNSGKCLEVGNFSSDMGAYIQQWEFSGHEFQLWFPMAVGDGSFVIYNKGSSLVLDVEGNSVDVGARIHQWPYWGTANQRWIFQRVY